MKHTLNIFAFALLSWLGTTTLIAQKDFEGKLSFSINYLDLPEDMKMMESMLPKEMLFYVKGSKARMEQAAVMGSQTVVIMDTKTDVSIVLMDFLGQKMAIEPTAEELKESKSKSERIEIKLSDETKTIAGFECKKVTMVDPETKTPVTVWFTDAIQNGMSQLPGVPGMPLEYTVDQEGMRMRITATEISKEKVSDELFKVPAGYEKMTSEELQKKFQTLGGE